MRTDTIAQHPEIPLPPGRPPHPAPPPPPPDVHVRTPMVYVEPTWEYRHVTRPAAGDDALDDAALDQLGADGWELVGVYHIEGAAHFYFKRQRP